MGTVGVGIAVNVKETDFFTSESAPERDQHQKIFQSV